MTNPMILKLSRGAKLGERDLKRLEDVTSGSQLVPARTDLISEGEAPDNVHLVQEGVACRYKILPGGKRSIMALLVPGDFCDLHVAILGQIDHSIGTLSDCRMARLPRATISDLTENYPSIARALWWARLVDEAVLREWLVGLGHRSAEKQMGHLFCELLLRLQTVGKADRASFELPLTQDEMADVLGITSVHVSRTLRTLRERRLVKWESGRITVLDFDGLAKFADFDPNYLHLSEAPSE